MRHRGAAAGLPFGLGLAGTEVQPAAKVEGVSAKLRTPAPLWLNPPAKGIGMTPTPLADFGVSR
jgi:hypothetical protein